jgi:kynurenine formamidase
VSTPARPGTARLPSTGWARLVSQAGAQWLSASGVYAAGSDTVGFEKLPDASMPVHVHLLVENGIHIIECLNLEELAAASVTEFLFVALPLKIRGATASPIRPVAIA